MTKGETDTYLKIDPPMVRTGMCVVLLALTILLASGQWSQADYPCTTPAFAAYPQFKIYDCSAGPKCTWEMTAHDWYQEWNLNTTYNDYIAAVIADSVEAFVLRNLDYYVPDPPH